MDFSCTESATAFFDAGACPRYAQLLLGTVDLYEGAYVGPYYISYTLGWVLLCLICFCSCCICWCFLGCREAIYPACCDSCLKCRCWCCCGPKSTAYSELAAQQNQGLMGQDGQEQSGGGGGGGMEMQPIAAVPAPQQQQQQGGGGSPQLNSAAPFMTVTVPQNIKGGQVFTVVSPLGRQLAVQCPVGAGPGTTVQVQNPDVTV
jgi:hypothetical protein